MHFSCHSIYWILLIGKLVSNTGPVEFYDELIDGKIFLRALSTFVWKSIDLISTLNDSTKKLTQRHKFVGEIVYHYSFLRANQNSDKLQAKMTWFLRRHHLSKTTSSNASGFLSKELRRIMKITDSSTQNQAQSTLSSCLGFLCLSF